MTSPQDMFLSIFLFIVGLVLLIYFAGKLVKGTVGTSLGFGISTFLVSVVFISFDPENLALGAVATAEGVSGIALGSIIGAAMVAIGLAFGLTALLSPMKFKRAPKLTVAIPIIAMLFMGGLALDGELSRMDGGLLLAAFALAIFTLFKLSQHGLDIQPTGEAAESVEELEKQSKWKSFGLLLLSLAGIILGSELLVHSSKDLMASLGLSDTIFGMTILALAVSFEELARELPAARKGRPEISYGNVSGSILAFFLFNAGIIALINPIQVSRDTLDFYYPLSLLTMVVVSIFMWLKRVPRWAGAILLLLYAVFFVGGYLR